MLSECAMQFFENDILTKEMLQHIYDDSFVLTKSLLADIKSAIVSGMKIYNTKNGDAKIGSGVLIVDGKLFVYDGNFIIKRKSLQNDQHYRVYIKKSNENYTIELEKDNNEDCENIIYRFLFDGGDIIKIPKNLNELIRDNVYLNVFDMPCCDLRGNYICNPIVAKCILNNLSNKEKKTFQEAYLYYELLNKGNVGISLVINYIYGDIRNACILNMSDLKILTQKISSKTLIVGEPEIQENLSEMEVKSNDSRVLTRKWRH